ncbi:MAG TPA: DUF3305 domain-containing protein [Casimicrobiaceae bacterium]|nr:DUF3305 domain-containing protein [Casimicrobiaceae bacterium]
MSAKTMLPVYFCVDVVMERVALRNRWASEQWQPRAVLGRGEGRAVPGAAECTLDTHERTLWRFPGMAIELHPSEAEGYFLNLTSETPVVFVMWRSAEDDVPPAARPVLVTLSYNEAARFMDGGERVDPVAIEAPIRAWLADFVSAHYKPEPKKKVKRNDPFAEDDRPERPRRP